MCARSFPRASIFHLRSGNPWTYDSMRAPMPVGLQTSICALSPSLASHCACPAHPTSTSPGPHPHYPQYPRDRDTHDAGARRHPTPLRPASRCLGSPGRGTLIALCPVIQHQPIRRGSDAPPSSQAIMQSPRHSSNDALSNSKYTFLRIYAGKLFDPISRPTPSKGYRKAHRSRNAR